VVDGCSDQRGDHLTWSSSTVPIPDRPQIGGDALDRGGIPAGKRRPGGVIDDLGGGTNQLAVEVANRDRLDDPRLPAVRVNSAPGPPVIQAEPCGSPSAATAALIAATTAGKALVDDDCAKKAVADLTRD